MYKANTNGIEVPTVADGSRFVELLYKTKRVINIKRKIGISPNKRLLNPVGISLNTLIWTQTYVLSENRTSWIGAQVVSTSKRDNSTK